MQPPKPIRVLAATRTHLVGPIPRGKTEVNGTCKDCRKRFTRLANFGGKTPVYCQKCELK